MKPEVESDVYRSVVTDVFSIPTEDVTSMIVIKTLHGILNLN